MEEEKLPIDRGWAWVTLAGTFTIQMVIIGCLKSFGLIYTEFLEYFQTSAGSTAWVLSLCIFLLMSCGTMSSSLGARFGFRPVIVAGSFLCCIGFVSSAFVPKVEYLYLTFGIFTGLGAGLTYTPTIVMVTLFFNKRRAFANGLTVAGNGIGYFLYPFLINYLLKEYTLFGTLIILGGVMLHSCIGAALMRPLESFKKKRGRELQSLEVNGDAQKQPEEGVQVETDPDTDKMLEHDPKSDKILENEPETDKMLENQPETDKMLENEQSQSTKIKESNNSCRTCIKNFSFKDIFDYTYLSNPVFLFWGFSFAAANMSYSNLFMVVPPHAKMHGISKGDLALLVSMAGLADLFGRIMFGFVSDLKFVRRRYVYIFGMIAGGASAILAPLATNFATLAVYSCWYGLFGGSYWSLVAPLLADSFGVDEISKVFGLTTSFISIPSLLSPPILGWLKDKTGNWDMSFRVAGVWMLLAGILAIFLPLGERYQQRRQRASSTPQNTTEDPRA